LWGADWVGLGSGLMGRGWTGAEAGVAGEAGCGAAAWGDDETEVARIEREEQAGLAELGLRLAEAKQLTAALQAQIVPAQVAVLVPVSAVAHASRAGACWPARVIMGRGFAPYSATCWPGSAGCSSTPIKM